MLKIYLFVDRQHR